MLPSSYCRELLDPLGAVVIDMEHRGVPIDRERCWHVQQTFEARAERTRESLAEFAEAVDYVGPEMPPNWASPQQLILFLHSELGLGLPLSPFRKKGAVRLDEGEISTDDRALEWIASQSPEYREGIGLIRRLRAETRMAKYAATWLELAIHHPDGSWRLHPSFGLGHDGDDRAGAVTGRFAIKNPPLQQVPARGEYGQLLRACFAAPPGYRLVVADYSQLEIYILAHLCNRLFGTTGLVGRLEPGQPDMHSATAQYVFGEVLGMPHVKAAPLHLFKEKGTVYSVLRNLVKAVRYGVNYGKTSLGFGSTLFDPDGSPLGEKRAQEMVDALFAFDPEIPRYQQFVEEYIREHGGIYSLLGRWCPLPDAFSRKPGLFRRALRRAYNFPMQAGGQEVTGLAMINIARDSELRALGYAMLLQVHDEIVGLVPEDNAPRAMERVTWCMENSLLLAAPLKVEGHHAERWSEAK